MENEQKEKFITTTQPGSKIPQMKCTACDKFLPKFLQQDALTNGCPHCRHRATLYDEDPDPSLIIGFLKPSRLSPNTNTPSLTPPSFKLATNVQPIHTFYRGEDGPKSRWRVAGFWEAGEEPVKRRANNVRCVVLSDTHEMEDQFRMLLICTISYFVLFLLSIYIFTLCFCFV
jgi:phage FluMu protein Com